MSLFKGHNNYSNKTKELKMKNTNYSPNNTNSAEEQKLVLLSSMLIETIHLVNKVAKDTLAWQMKYANSSSKGDTNKDIS